MLANRRWSLLHCFISRSTLFPLTMFYRLFPLTTMFYRLFALEVFYRLFPLTMFYRLFPPTTMFYRLFALEVFYRLLPLSVFYGPLPLIECYRLFPLLCCRLVPYPDVCPDASQHRSTFSGAFLNCHLQGWQV